MARDEFDYVRRAEPEPRAERQEQRLTDDPRLRSELRRLKRKVRALSAAQRGQPLPNENEVVRSPGIQQQSGFSAGGRSAPLAFGRDVDKPTTKFLLARGTGAFLYIAQDVNKVYLWNGTAYKSATFS